MKKLLTVLLVIAVICTFSFGSAFAGTVDKGVYTYGTANGTPNQLRSDAAYVYDANNAGDKGITEQYRAELLEELENADADYVEANFYVPEQAAATAAIADATAAVKAATTAKEAYTAMDSLETKLAKLDMTAIYDKYVSPSNAFVNAVSQTSLYAGLTASSASMAEVSGQKYYILEGVGLVNATKLDSKTAGSKDVVAGLDATETNLYIGWMMNNNYRTTKEVIDHTPDFLAALTPVTTTYYDAMLVEGDKLATRIETLGKKANLETYQGAVSVADLDTAEALIDDVAAFEEKYAGLAKVTFDADALTVMRTAYNLYINQFYAEIEALPTYSRLADTDKANVIALYDKQVALLEVYDAVEGLIVEPSCVNFDTLEKAYNFFKDADLEALQKLSKEKFEGTTAFTVMIPGATNYVFDASEANVTKLANARAAFDEFVKNYDYVNETFWLEARLLAAEYNQKAAAGFDEKADKKATSYVQTYLNNATVKVTSTKLAAKKVRVQAKVDSTTLEQILGQLTAGCTIEYKFYFKAPGKSFKLTKAKDVNYITYTSKSLKAGKNSFRVGLVVKDADGKVIAEKSYQASTLAYRTIK